MLIFDWEGQPVKSYYLTGVLQALHLTCGKKMYAFDSNEEHFNIIEFDLSRLEF